MFSIWGIGVFLSILISLVYKFNGSLESHPIKYFIYVHGTESAVIAYCRPFIDVPFVLLAVAVYYKIFDKYHQSRQRVNSATTTSAALHGGVKRKQESGLELFIHSRYIWIRCHDKATPSRIFS